MSLFESDFDKEDIQTLSNKNQIVVSKKVKEIEKPKQVLPEYVPVDYRNRVSIVKKLNNIQGYDDFTKELYPYSINFYDFEVFMCDWCVTIINPVRKEMTIIVNDEEELKRYYETSKNEIWCGYNSKNYDSTILKAILCDMNPKKVNDQIIILGKRAWEIDRQLSQYQLYDYDAAVFDKGRMISLKELEASMGNDIRETEVDFDIPRQLNKSEILKTIKYNKHDVEQLIEVFRRTKSDFDAVIGVINLFNFPISYVGKTTGQLTALVTECEKQPHDDDFDITILPCVQLNKYKYIQDWFIEACKKKDYSAGLEAEIAGIPHKFGWGGIHGAANKPVYVDGRIFHADVGSYYPSQMIQWNLLTRNCKKPEKFKEVYDMRMALKKAGKKKEQQPLKLLLNAQYGIMKDKFNAAYDPVQANNICINGQLMLVDLIEHLEEKMGSDFELIQSNTDGIIVKITDDDKTEKIFRHICNNWCERTRMTFAYDSVDWYYAKDVNNYIFSFKTDDKNKLKLERKGSYVKEVTDLNNNLAIVKKALVNYMCYKTLPEETIQEALDKKSLIDFQVILRINGNFKFAWHNGKFLSDRTFRVFASNDETDTFLGKCRSKQETVNRFANAPEHCFIINDDIHGKWDDRLDADWYIKLAYKMLSDFGINLKQEQGLF